MAEDKEIARGVAVTPVRRNRLQAFDRRHGGVAARPHWRCKARAGVPGFNRISAQQVVDLMGHLEGAV